MLGRRRTRYLHILYRDQVGMLQSQCSHYLCRAVSVRKTAKCPACQCYLSPGNTLHCDWCEAADYIFTRREQKKQHQWRSQSAANARAQHGHTTFVNSLYPGPAQLSAACSTEMQKQLGGSGGMLSQKILEFLSFLGRFWGYFRPYRRL